jgi:hypothetical protein
MYFSNATNVNIVKKTILNEAFECKLAHKFMIDFSEQFGSSLIKKLLIIGLCKLK